MSEVIITPSDLSEDAEVELTIPTSWKDNMKITMGEFIDEEIIEDENKLLSVKLKVPDVRPYSDYSSIYWKHNQILDELNALLIYQQIWKLIRKYLPIILKSYININ